MPENKVEYGSSEQHIINKAEAKGGVQSQGYWTLSPMEAHDLFCVCGLTFDTR